MIKRDANGSDEEKSRIRERYRGVAPETLEVIPAIQEASFYDDEGHKRVAVYVRVSTDDPRQTSSFELQRHHYEDLIERHPNWELVGIYADEGISGTSLKHRVAFQQMIKACEDRKVDLILCKSISRFSRNVVDCISIARALTKLKNPVGIFFETEHLFTLNQQDDMFLGFLSTLAQEESHMKSNSMNLSYEMRFRRGVFLTPALLGYDLDEEGNMVINEEEALTVRLAFFMYLFGYASQQIADTLIQLGRLTKKGHRFWSAGTVLGVLQNEKYCGTLRARKTWTPDYLDHKSKKNVRNRNQYCKPDHHDAIISKDDFIAAQQLIANAKYGYKGVLPMLHVVDEGPLKGFVIANLRWAGFAMDDYLAASDSVCPVPDEPEGALLEAAPAAGEFDLSGYEVVRAEFFGSFHKQTVTFSREHVYFSAHCIAKFAHTAHIEILYQPRAKMIAVRPASKDNRSTVQWAKIEGDRYLPRMISGSVFLDVLYGAMNWDAKCKYRVRGVQKQNETGTVILFDLKEMEAIIPLPAAHLATDAEPSARVLPNGVTPLAAHSRSSVIAFPAEWADRFGRTVYQEKPLADAAVSGDTQHGGVPYRKAGDPLQVTSTEDLSMHIETLVSTMRQGE